MIHQGKTPKIHENAVILPSVSIIGDVEIGALSSVWFGAVVRGDVNFVRVGERTNIQDNAVVHVTHKGSPAIIGNDVTIGHTAIIHACTIEDRVLVGMGAIVMDNVTIGEDCLVAAGSILSPGKKFPSGHLIKGAPAKVVRSLTASEMKSLADSANHYVNVSKSYSITSPTE